MLKLTKTSLDKGLFETSINLVRGSDFIGGFASKIGKNGH